MKTFLRVDKRPFSRDDPVESSAQFLQDHTPEGKVAEELLEAGRPSERPKRGAYPFVFENEDDAKWYCAKNLDRRLYRVTVGEILFRADMSIVDELGITTEEAKRLQLVRDYWNGVIGATPIVEVMVASAQVIEEIVLSSEERRTLWEDHGLPRFDPTKVSDDDYPFLHGKET